MLCLYAKVYIYIGNNNIIFIQSTVKLRPDDNANDVNVYCVMSEKNKTSDDRRCTAYFYELTASTSYMFSIKQTNNIVKRSSTPHITYIRYNFQGDLHSARRKHLSIPPNVQCTYTTCWLLRVTAMHSMIINYYIIYLLYTGILVPIYICICKSYTSCSGGIFYFIINK